MSKVLVIWCAIGPDRAGDVFCVELKTSKLSLLKRFHNQFHRHPDTPKILSRKIDKFFFRPSGKFKFNKSRVFVKPGRNVRYDLVVVTGMYLRRK